MSLSKEEIYDLQFKEKYLKYKKKYINLKNQLGGLGYFDYWNYFFCFNSLEELEGNQLFKKNNTTYNLDFKLDPLNLQNQIKKAEFLEKIKYRAYHLNSYYGTFGVAYPGRNEPVGTAITDIAKTGLSILTTTVSLGLSGTNSSTKSLSLPRLPQNFEYDESKIIDKGYSWDSLLTGWMNTDANINHLEINSESIKKLIYNINIQVSRNFKFSEKYKINSPFPRIQTIITFLNDYIIEVVKIKYKTNILKDDATIESQKSFITVETIESIESYKNYYKRQNKDGLKNLITKQFVSVANTTRGIKDAPANAIIGLENTATKVSSGVSSIYKWSKTKSSDKKL